ncbi:hypothetical protein Tco_0188954 [Tanacetum coccineum]
MTHIQMVTFSNVLQNASTKEFLSILLIVDHVMTTVGKLVEEYACDVGFITMVDRSSAMCVFTSCHTSDDSVLMPP